MKIVISKLSVIMPPISHIIAWLEINVQFIFVLSTLSTQGRTLSTQGRTLLTPFNVTVLLLYFLNVETVTKLANNYLNFEFVFLFDS